MKDRIVQFLESEKISPAEFADKIGVQRSSMSHILNGRNYPSAAFIQKMLQVYPLVNPRWLMIGEGSMNEESTDQKEKLKMRTPIIQTEILTSLSDVADASAFPASFEMNTEKSSVLATEREHILPDNDKNGSGIHSSPGDENKRQPTIEKQVPGFTGLNTHEVGRTSNTSSLPTNTIDDKEIEQILFFYTDKTFSIYRPS